MRAALLVMALIAAAVANADDLYVFTRAECGPCQLAKKAFADDASLAGGCQLHVVDTRLEPVIAAKRRVSAVPTIVLERDGREIARKVGWAGASEFRRWLEKSRHRRSRR